MHASRDLNLLKAKSSFSSNRLSPTPACGCPSLKRWVGSRRSFPWGRGGEQPPVLLLGKFVLIPICPLYQDTITRVDPVHFAHAERARSPHGHTTQVDTCRRERLWHLRSHLLLTHLVAAREAFCCPVGATMLASACCLDPERLQPQELDARDLSHAQRVVGLRFRDAQARPVPPRSSSRPGADGHPSAVSPGPGEDVTHTGAHRGRQPPFGNSPGVEAWRAVTQIGTASTPSGIALGLLASMDELSSMLHFGAKERMMHLSRWRLFCPHQGHAAGSAARVNFEHALL